MTNNFSFRFFTSMLGMVVVNAFFAHRFLNDKQVRIHIAPALSSLISLPFVILFVRDSYILHD